MENSGQTKGLSPDAGQGAEAQKTAPPASVGPTRLGWGSVECAVHSTRRLGNASPTMHVVVHLAGGTTVVNGIYGAVVVATSTQQCQHLGAFC
jgi:hypothetical protein